MKKKWWKFFYWMLNKEYQGGYVDRKSYIFTKWFILRKIALLSLLFIFSSCIKNTYRCERLFKENLQLKNQLNEMQKVVRQITNNAEKTELQNRRLREFIKYKTHE